MQGLTDFELLGDFEQASYLQRPAFIVAFNSIFLLSVKIHIVTVFIQFFFFFFSWLVVLPLWFHFR